MSLQRRFKTLARFKGLRTAGVNEDYDEGELQLLENCHITDYGSIVSRNAWTSAGTLDPLKFADSIELYRNPSTGNTEVLIARDNNTIIAVDVDTSTTYTLGTGNGQDGVRVNDKLYIASNNVALISYNSAHAFTALTGTPSGNRILFHKERLWVFNSFSGLGVANNSRLYYSEVGLYDTAGDWPGANFIDINPGDGDYLTGMVVLGDYILLFKRFSSYILSVDGSPASWSLSTANATIGCCGRNTPVLIDGFVYFLGANAVYKTDGTSFEIISEPIESIITALDIKTHTKVHTRSAVLYGRLYVMNLDPASNTLYVYNVESKAWSKWTSISLFGKLLSDDDVHPWRILAVDSAPPTYSRLISTTSAKFGNDTAGPYTAVVRTPKLHLGKNYMDIATHMMTSVEVSAPVGITFSSYTYKDVSGYALAGTGQSTDALLGQRNIRFPGAHKHRWLQFELRWASHVNPNRIEIHKIDFDIREGNTRDAVG